MSELSAKQRQILEYMKAEFQWLWAWLGRGESAPSFPDGTDAHAPLR